MTIQTTRTAHVLRAGAAFALAITAVGGLATTSQAATSTQAAMTLSSATGKEAGGQSITGTTTTNKFYTGKVYVQFQLTTTLTANCQTTFTTPAANQYINATSTAIITARKVNIVVPVLTAAAGAGTTQYWQVCAYNGNTAGTSTLLAKGSYTSTAAPTITALTADHKIPTYGGTVNVVGTNFVAPLTATIGGLAMTDVSIVDSTLFTATAPAHAAGDVAMTVTSVGGSVTILSTATNAFTYVDSLSVSPNTGVSGAATPVTVAISGTGFNNISWGDTTGAAVAGAGDVPTKGPDSNGAHLYLLSTAVAGVPRYDATGFAIATPVSKTIAEAGECQNVAVISDTELTCSLDLANGYVAPSGANTQAAQSTGGDIATGLYTIALVDDGDLAARDYADGASGGASPGYPTQLSSTNVFVVAPF